MTDPTARKLALNGYGPPGGGLSLSETTSEPKADGAVLIIGTGHRYQRHQDQKETRIGAESIRKACRQRSARSKHKKGHALTPPPIIPSPETLVFLKWEFAVAAGAQLQSHFEPHSREATQCLLRADATKTGILFWKTRPTCEGMEERLSVPLGFVGWRQ